MKLHGIDRWVVALAITASLVFTGLSFAHHPETKATFTTDSAIEVPGKTLNAKTNYALKVLKSDTDRHVVQIYSEDERNLLTTFLAESNPMDATAQTGFSYIQTEAGYPRAAKSWSQTAIGRLSFVYSTDQARQIAQHSNESVLSTNARVTANTTNLDGISVAALQPGTGERDTRVAENLPATAGELPLLALMGMLALGCGAALRLSHSR